MKTESGFVTAQIFISARPATLREIKEGDSDLEWEYLQGPTVYEFHGYEHSSSGSKVSIGSASVVIPITGGIDITERMVEELEREKQQELSRHHIATQEIDHKIQSLRAIEHKPTLVAAD